MRRRLLNDICQIEFVDKIDTIAGDVCIVDNATLDKYFITPDSIKCINPDKYTPIGLVVIPQSHTDNNTVRIMSLKFMSPSHPDDGNTVSSYFRYSQTEEDPTSSLPHLNQTPYIWNSVETISGCTEEQKLLGFTDIANRHIPSDKSGSENYKYPYDSISYYCSYLDEYEALPSPYLEDGSKNSIYHSTANTGNALADMDGKGNTEKLLETDNSYSTDWQTAESIGNEDNIKYYHPAAQCCWRYHTIGTNQGDWYIPSAGEMGYYLSRIIALRKTIEIIKDDDRFEVASIIFNGPFDKNGRIMTSTLYGVSSDSSNICYISCETATSARHFNKHSRTSGIEGVKAFCQI